MHIVTKIFIYEDQLQCLSADYQRFGHNNVSHGIRKKKKKKRVSFHSSLTLGALIVYLQLEATEFII